MYVNNLLSVSAGIDVSSGQGPQPICTKVQGWPRTNDWSYVMVSGMAQIYLTSLTFTTQCIFCVDLWMSLFYIEREARSIGCPLVCWPLHMHYDASVLMLLSAGELYSSFASSLWVALESVTQQRQYPLAHLNWYSWSTGYSYEYTKLTGRLGKENVWELLVWPSPQPITTHVWCVYAHSSRSTCQQG